MLLRFATKKDVNGNRYYFAFNPDSKVYAIESPHWYSRDDIIEISKKDRRRLIEQVQAANYKEVSHL